MDIMQQALRSGKKTLSEYDSKRLLEAWGIPVVREVLVDNSKDLLEAAEKIGFPVVLKFCAPEMSHKTEMGLVKIDIRNEVELTSAFDCLRKRSSGIEGRFVVQEMVKGSRELMIGMTKDPQFGVCVMFGLGGIFTEILEDVSFRVAPITKHDAREMIREIRAHRILNAIRNMEAVDLDVLSQSLIALGALGMQEDIIQEVDVNPLIICGKNPVAVDALVVLKPDFKGHTEQD
jgi:acetyl-CoA synthetase (ADP-forming)